MADNCIRKLKQSSCNRESYDEITELEAELRRAYIAKELRAQVLEKETERYIESVRKQQSADLIRLQQQVNLESDLCRRSEKLKKCEDYKKHLIEQITRKEVEANVRKDEARKEREVLIEVDKIREYNEAIKIREMKNEVSESMKRERLIFEEMKSIRRQEEAEAELKKELEDQKYFEEIEQRAKNLKEMREEQERRKEEAIQKIANILISMETWKREKEILIGELLAEDVKCEILMMEKEEATKRKKMKEELAADLKEQIIFTEQCKLRFVEQDRAFAEEVMKRVMENERIMRLTSEAKRRMQFQYREDLKRLIEKRRAIREEEIMKTKDGAKEMNDQLRKKLERNIKEERKRLLEKHATNVVDFLNKNVLTEEERKIVKEI